ncbi:hypothetical protein QVD17_14013 [Tagetes erecta]|uniref:Uncharacterized protein n=1 Tax=Tagetes erecta TaxID=13708 RepID=A0AAD8NWH3_TARER|nr:hypothetical protein QVD17_14013 [Tagetes erecta]
MEAKLERPKLEHAKTTGETKMSGNLEPQSPRHQDAVGFVRLSHLSVKEGGGMSRATSEGKINCLCSPTTHTGSFRCRHHRTYSHSSHSMGSGGKSFNSLSNLAGGHD